MTVFASMPVAEQRSSTSSGGYYCDTCLTGPLLPSSTDHYGFSKCPTCGSPENPSAPSIPVSHNGYQLSEAKFEKIAWSHESGRKIKIILEENGGKFQVTLTEPLNSEHETVTSYGPFEYRVDAYNHAHSLRENTLPATSNLVSRRRESP